MWGPSTIEEVSHGHRIHHQPAAPRRLWSRVRPLWDKTDAAIPQMPPGWGKKKLSFWKLMNDWHRNPHSRSLCEACGKVACSGSWSFGASHLPRPPSTPPRISRSTAIPRLWGEWGHHFTLRHCSVLGQGIRDTNTRHHPCFNSSKALIYNECISKITCTPR